MNKRFLLVCALALGLSSTAYAQRWEPISQKTSQIRKDVDVKYAYKVDLTSLRNILKDAVETGNNAKGIIISLPTVDGKIEKFEVFSNPVMEKSMADRYQLGSYVGVGVDDPSKYLRFSTSPTELSSMIIKNGEFQFLEPISSDKNVYGVFYKTKRTQSEQGFECGTNEKKNKAFKPLLDNGKKKMSSVGITSRPSSTKYRTYRLAVSVTSEYTQFFLGVPGAVAQINNTMTRVNGVFEKDFGIKLLVQDLPGIIYTNASTDPYSDAGAGSAGAWNLELQQTLTSQVGNANYDIGHLFGAAGGGGNAGCIGCICVDPTTVDPEGKGSGFTSPYDGVPSGDLFDIDYVAHEMGHQVGGNHTFSKSSEGSGVNIEPGGGTTIMGYAGITYDNVQLNSDAYFHYASINQILNNLDSKPTTCGISQNITTNTPPTIGALASYNIPKGTAYYLEAAATDTQNDPLKYTWEQYDSVDDYATISGDTGWGYNTQGSIARSYFGTASGRRYFPNLKAIMAGKLTDKANWETVSYIPRTLHYAVTVRDENNVRPMLSSSETTVVVGNDGPFKFSGLTASTILYNNAPNTIQWDVANTQNAPYNASNVKIEYTTDLVNGSTWTELLASVPNTGSYQVQMPISITTPIKLRISAIGNVFFAISPTINVAAAPTSTSNAPTGLSTTMADIQKTTARVGWNSISGATYVINYRKQGTTAWSNATSTTNSILLSGLEDETNHEVQVASVVNGVSSPYSLIYTFKTLGLTTGADYCIVNSGTSDYAVIRKVVVSNISHDDNTMRTYKDLSEDASKVVNLIQGTQYTITPTILISSGYAQMASRPINVSVWIDYNRNGIFEISERVVSVGGTSPTGSVSVGAQAFTVPATSYAGDKLLRMRIVGKYATSALANPCGDLASGAGGIMDLPVRITSTALSTTEVNDTKSNISIYPNPADTFVEVKNLKGKANYTLYSVDGKLVQKGSIENQRINVNGLLKGVYMITIKDEAITYSTKLIKK